MRRNRCIPAGWTIIVFTVGILGVAAAAGAQATRAEVGEPSHLPSFGLQDHLGEWHDVRRYGADHKAIVLYFQGNGCPINRRSFPRIMALRDTFEPKGVKFLMINANPHDDRESVQEEMEDFEVDIPVLLDEYQIIAAQLNVERTCEAILVDTADWSIRYRGAVDDSIDYLGRRETPLHTWLEDALTAVLEGEDIAVGWSEPKGCLIHFQRTPEEVSYANDIAPILAEKCVTCHSPGNIGPFSLDSHRRVRGWASMIKEVTLTHRMPPWYADPHIGTFSNEMRLTKDEMRKLVAWIDAGAPKDGDEDPLVAAANREAPKWPLGEPDLVVQLPEPQHIPAEGLFDYTYIDIPSGLTEDKWVRAYDVRPTNREVSHHILVFSHYPPHLSHLQPRVEGGLGGYFAGYLPGQDPQVLPEGTGKFVPAGTTFQFQLHYNATGRPEVDQTEMALYFHDEAPDRVLAVRSAHTIEFEIEPHDPNSPIEAEHFVSRDSLLFGMSPHMHYRGKRMAFEARYPDGEVVPLLSVPYYNFDWQIMYRLAEPLAVPAGTVIRAEGAWDNSARNPFNPDPDATVYFGDQTVDEMFVGYLMYSYDPSDEPLEPPRRERPQVEGIRTGIPLDEETIVDSVWQVDVYRFHFKADGVLTVSNAVNGTWRIEGDSVFIDVAGRQNEFYIEGDILTTGRGHEFPRLE